MAYEEELKIARLAVQRASLVTKRIRPLLETNDEINKDDDTPVTIADLTAQALVIGAIHHAFPQDTFLAEESAKVLREDSALADRVWDFVSTAGKHCGDHVQSQLFTPKSKDEMLDVIDLGTGAGGPQGRFWILDPIDGTISYIAGKQYAVCLCLVEDGVKRVAAQGCPNLSLETAKMTEDTVDLGEKGGYIVSALSGSGAFTQRLSDGELEAPQPIHKKKDSVPFSELGNIESLASGSMDHAKIKAVCDKLGVAYPGVDIWAQQMKYIAMAIGGHDLMVRIPAYASHRTAAWDHASGQLICEEAGLKMTDVYGKVHDYSQGRRLYANLGDVAAPAGVHDEVLRVVKEVMGGVGS